MAWAGLNLKEIHKQKLKGVLHPSIVHASSVGVLQNKCTVHLYRTISGPSKVCAPVMTKCRCTLTVQLLNRSKQSVYCKYKCSKESVCTS